MKWLLIADSIIISEHYSLEEAQVAKMEYIAYLSHKLEGREIVSELEGETTRIRSRSVGYVYNGQLKLNHVVGLVQYGLEEKECVDAETQTDSEPKYIVTEPPQMVMKNIATSPLKPIEEVHIPHAQVFSGVECEGQEDESNLYWEDFTMASLCMNIRRTMLS
jgi:hypothetical protein